jgi:hypothetical protein
MVMSQPGGLSPALASRMERISLILRGGEDEDRRGEEGWRGEEKERRLGWKRGIAVSNDKQVISPVSIKFKRQNELTCQHL